MSPYCGWSRSIVSHKEFAADLTSFNVFGQLVPFKLIGFLLANLRDALLNAGIGSEAFEVRQDSPA